MSTIFIDRDGVINENRADHVKNWAEFRFLDGACEAMAKLTRAGHRLIVCTNQAVIARGIVSISTVEEIHRRMVNEIALAGGHIEKVYYCPHSKEGYCPCRKPRPGMLLRARDELDLDLHNSVFIGDSMSDIQAGLAAGVHPILVLTGLGLQQLQHASEIRGTFEVRCNLLHAAELLLQA